MTPSNEQFELAAKAAKIKLAWFEGLPRILPNEADYFGEVFPTVNAWQPHIPGVDNAMLAAALEISPYPWDSERAFAETKDSEICEEANYSDFTGTDIERRAKATAFAVFLVAVEIGKGV